MSNDPTPGDPGEPVPGDAVPEPMPAPGAGAIPPADRGPAGGRHGRGGHRGMPLLALARSGFIEYDRVLFFSDAVFAIAITLLAVDLRVPRSGHLGKPEVLGLVGFGISFAVIGLFWLGHHAIFRHITAFDRPLISINLLFLGTVAILPYPTNLLFQPSSRPDDPTAVVFYAAFVAAAGTGEFAIWLYATWLRPSLADPSAAGVRLYYALRIARVPVVFLISIPVALVSPANAPYIWILAFVFGIAINRFIPQPDPPEEIGEEMSG